MSYSTPDFNAIRDSILRDIQNQLPGANIAPDGDYYIRANAEGAAIEGLYQHQQWIVRQIFPDTADDDNLEKHASLRGLSRKVATTAMGTVAFTGQANATIPVGTELKDASGNSYLTTVTAQTDNTGTVTVAVQATIAGVSGNQTAGSVLTLTSAPSGILSTATVVSMSGGTNPETSVSLLARLLFVLRNPPCGGAAHDYYIWATNVAGVTAAYVYPNRRGLGTVDVIILTAGGIPDATLVANVQNVINAQRPVNADCLVFAPTTISVSVVGRLVLASGVSLATVTPSINTALAAYFSTLKPGDTVYENRIIAAITSVSGIVDYTLTSPTANVTTIVDATHTQLAVLGNTVWS